MIDTTKNGYQADIESLLGQFQLYSEKDEKGLVRILGAKLVLELLETLLTRLRSVPDLNITDDPKKNWITWFRVVDEMAQVALGCSEVPDSSLAEVERAARICEELAASPFESRKAETNLRKIREVAELNSGSKK